MSDCLQCDSLRQELARVHADNLRGETVSYKEHEQALLQVAGLEREVRSKRAENMMLRNQLNESRSPENKMVREICDHHDALWKATFPRAKGITYTMDSTSAIAARRAIRLKFSVEEIKSVIDWVFASDFHRSKKAYLELDSILLNDKRIRGKLHQIEEKNAKDLWAPIDRVLLALRNRGLRWDGVYVGAQDEGRIWRHVAECPLCHQDLLVGVRLENDWASVRCLEGCDFFRVLEALGVDPTELSRRFDPAVVEALESAQTGGPGGPRDEGFCPPQGRMNGPLGPESRSAPSRASEQRMAA